jgi:hypothetical protein
MPSGGSRYQKVESGRYLAVARRSDSPPRESGVRHAECVAEFLVVAKADGSDRTLLCSDQQVAAEHHGFTVIEFVVEAPTRGFARKAWDADRVGGALQYAGRNTDDDWGLESLSDADRAAVVRLVDALVREDRIALEAAGGYRSPDDDPYLWTRSYGRWDRVDLVMPPGDPLHWAGGVLRGDDGEPFGVVVDMWTEQEGPSELSLEADLHRAGTHVMAHFNNLHVM